MSPQSLEDLIRAGRLERVNPDAEAARTRVDEAKLHLRSARQIADADPNGAYQLLYDASRKALRAHMLANGLRPANRPGAHDATGCYGALMLASPGAAVRRFDAMRRNRNRSEYGVMLFERSLIERDLVYAERIVAAVEENLP